MQQSALALRDADDFVRGVSPLLELGAYEWLWAQPGATFKSIADRFRARPDALPSDFVPHALAERTARAVVAYGGEVVPELLEASDPLSGLGAGASMRFTGAGFVLADSR